MEKTSFGVKSNYGIKNRFGAKISIFFKEWTFINMWDIYFIVILEKIVKDVDPSKPFKT
jgi:hypothetical protein